MKYQAEFATPEETQSVVNVIENNGGQDIKVTKDKITFVIGADDGYDLGSAIRAIQNDLVDESNIYVEIPKPVEIPETAEAPSTEKVSIVTLVDELRAGSKEEAQALVTELKQLHTAVENKLKRLAIDWELYISLGDYGYGRSIDGSNWNDSGCEWDTSTEPNWVSSSAYC